MSDGLWACVDCGNVIAGSETTPPDTRETRPCPACGHHEDRAGWRTYRRIDR